MGGDPAHRRGIVAPEVADELPGLRLLWRVLPARRERSPRWLRDRLRRLSDGPRGSGVIAMRTHAIPQAHRTFFRQIGLDPDTVRIPSEQAAVNRLVDGEFASRDLVSDALLAALVETGVAVWAFDAGWLEGELSIRLSRPDELLGEGEAARRLPDGRLVVASARPHALLFGAVAPGQEVSERTGEAVLFTVGVPGVPDIHLEEALWMAADLLRE